MIVLDIIVLFLNVLPQVRLVSIPKSLERHYLNIHYLNIVSSNTILHPSSAMFMPCQDH